MLSGYKTYITAIVAIVTALGTYASGDATLIQALQLTVTALLGAFIRSGVASGG